MKQKNSPGRKNIRRINALDRLQRSLEVIKKSGSNIKKETIQTIIFNTEAKILDQNIARQIKTKIFRGQNN